jgi:hypothetical protein
LHTVATGYTIARRRRCGTEAAPQPTPNGGGEKGTYKTCIMPKFEHKDIREITQLLDTGFRCFYHRETGDLLSFPDEFKHIGMDTEPWTEEMEKFEADPFSYKEVEPIRSQDSFSIMADFAEQMTGNNRLQIRLIDALNRKHPFRNFKFIIDNSGDYRQQWFAYRDSRLMEFVRERLERDEDD